MPQINGKIRNNIINLCEEEQEPFFDEEIAL